jgi:glucosamine-6-phosphate deaminase
MKHLSADSLNVEIHPDRASMGAAAAKRAASILRRAISDKGFARVILASAPSQDEVLAALTAAPELDWSRVTIFHMDEYVGLTGEDPASFRKYQSRHVLSQVHPAAFHGIRGEAPDVFEECLRYARLLAEAPIDLVCMGIGENGHIAFNDPPVADFQDTMAVKVVDLDDACRRQQVNDGCFPDFDAVPRQAITLTCPTLMSARALVCVVPGPRKAAAVKATLHDPVTTACPATILRHHPSAVLYLDSASASLL